MPLICKALALLLPLLLFGCSKERVAADGLAALESSVAASELEYQEVVEAFRPRYEALVEKYWGTAAALSAQLWLLEATLREADPQNRREAIESITGEILAEYGDTSLLDQLAEHSDIFSDEQKERYFGQLREATSHANVRAAAMYVLAEMGGSRYASDELKQRRKVLLQDLLDNYADVTARYSTYGDLADAALYPHDPADLAIGRPAPEIVGKTYDGQSLRLSDFAGKVVVLDFWGDW